jgi:hypothetical protein
MGILDRSVATDDGFREYGRLFAIDTAGRFCADSRRRNSREDDQVGYPERVVLGDLTKLALVYRFS